MGANPTVAKPVNIKSNRKKRLDFICVFFQKSFPQK